MDWTVPGHWFPVETMRNLRHTGLGKSQFWSLLPVLFSWRIQATSTKPGRWFPFYLFPTNHVIALGLLPWLCWHLHSFSKDVKQKLLSWTAPFWSAQSVGPCTRQSLCMSGLLPCWILGCGSLWLFWEVQLALTICACFLASNPQPLATFSEDRCLISNQTREERT